MSLGCGVIGAGIRGRHSWERILAAHPEVEIRALSPDPLSTPEMLEGYNEADVRKYAAALGAEYVPDYNDLLRRKDIGLVSLMVEPRRVPEVGCLVADAGKHIITDKPIATNLADARQLVACCQRNGVKTLVTYHMRYNLAVETAQRSVQSGTIGKPLAAGIRLLFHNGPLAGFTATAGYAAAVGGGELTNFGSYAIDILSLVLQSRVTRVYADLATYFYPDYQQAEIEDFAVLMLELESGVQCHLVTGRTTAKISQPTLHMDVIGTKGAIRVNGDSDQVQYWPAEGLSRRTAVDATSSQRLIATFIDAIINDHPSPIPIDRGLEVQAVLAAAYQSARTRSWVEV
jgi:UDP-N-acetylglucosamine 3-dehydrogenase